MDTHTQLPDRIEQILDDFEFLDDWEDRYRYVIELGRGLEPLEESLRTDTNKVQGCVSQVWLHSQVAEGESAGPVLVFVGDSDAHIVRGLIAILFALFNGQPATNIVRQDVTKIFDRLGLQDHLTPQRSNGLFAMVDRIKRDAQSALQ